MYSSVRSSTSYQGEGKKASFQSFVFRDPSEWRKMRDPKYWEAERSKVHDAAGGEQNPYNEGPTANLAVEVQSLRKENEDLQRRIENLEQKGQCQEMSERNVTSEHVDNDDPPVEAEEGQQVVSTTSSRSGTDEKDIPSTTAHPPVLVDNESRDATVSFEGDDVIEVGTEQGQSLVGGGEEGRPPNKRINERRRARTQQEGSSEGNPGDDMVFAFQCDKCDKRFMHKFGLRVHQGNMHPASNPNSVKKFPCKVCGSLFRAPHHVRQHEVVHTPKDDFKCVHCNRSFGTSIGLKCHQRKARCAKAYRRKSYNKSN